MIRRSYLLSALLVATALPIWTSSAQDAKTVDQLFEQELGHVTGGDAGEQSEASRAQTVKELLGYLATDDEVIRYEAEQLLKKIAKREDLELIVNALGENSLRPASQVSIVNVLGKIGDPVATNALKREYGFEKREVQLAILNALGNIREDTVVSFLSQALRTSGDTELEQAAIRSLAHIGDQRAIYAIESSVNKNQAVPTKIATGWALDLLKGVRDPKRIDKTFYQGKPQILFYKGMAYHYFRPTTLSKDERNPWLLTCVHGEELRPEDVFNICLPLAKQYRLALLAPFFDPLDFPDYQDLNIHGERADTRLFELIDFLAAETGLSAREVYFFGHGKGGEFVERLTLAHPDRVARSAFYTSKFMPLDPEKYYPFGLKSPPIASDLRFDMNRIIKTDFAILIDPLVAANRAYKTFYSATVDYAEKNQMTSRVRPRVLSQERVSLKDLWEEAARYLFSTCS